MVAYESGTYKGEHVVIDTSHIKLNSTIITIMILRKHYTKGQAKCLLWSFVASKTHAAAISFSYLSFGITNNLTPSLNNAGVGLEQ